MNFKVFGGLLAAVGFILGLIGFPQVFPNFGKSREQQLTEAMHETSNYFVSADCFFHDNNCDSDVAHFPTGPVLFWGGFALLILGLIIFFSAKPNSK